MEFVPSLFKAVRRESRFCSIVKRRPPLDIKRHRRAIQIISIFLLSGVIIVLNACIVDVIQPDSAVAGQIIVVEVLIEPEPITDTTYSLYLGVRVPSGWSVKGNPTYTGGPTGTLTYNPAIASQLETQFGVIADTIWWGGAGPGEYWSPEVTVTTIITIKTSIAASGIYTLNYVAGTDIEPPNWGEVVTRSITITPLLTLIKAVNTDSPNPGQRITYTITVENSSLNNATNAVISDTLPDGLTFAGPVTLEGTSGTTGAPPILASDLTITAGTRITLTFPVTVNTGQDSGTIIINTAAVTSAEVTTPQSDPELIILLDTISPTFPITDLLTGSPLITPTLGVILDTARPLFKWYAAWDNGQVLTYILTLSSTVEGLSLQTTTDSITTTQTSFTPTVDLPDGVYTWTVQAQDAAGNQSEDITPQNFTIQVSMKDVYLPIILKND